MLLGPTPNVDIVLSICLQADIPNGQVGKLGASPAPATSDLSGSSKSRPVPSSSSFKQLRDRLSGKRKDSDSKFPSASNL